MGSIGLFYGRRVAALGSHTQGFRVSGFGVRFQGLGFRVEG
jgi:hypothetical protein